MLHMNSDNEPPLNGPWGKPKSSGRANKPRNSNGGGNQEFDVEDVIKNVFTKFASKSGKSGGNGSGGNDNSGSDGSWLETMSWKGLLFGILIAAAGWGATGFYTVGPKELGVELVFGKVSDIARPGLHYNFPSPVGEVLLPQVTNVNQEEVGFRSTSGVAQLITAESLMLTGDENIIDIQFAVFWRISDARKYLFNIRNPERSVKNVAEAAMREIVGKTDFEYARTSGRTILANNAKDLIQKTLDGYQSGIEIVNVNLQQVDPPEKVLGAFRDVQAARADKESRINEATAYLNEIIERAQGQSEQITQSAQAYKEEGVARAEGDAERFLLVLGEYKNAKDITKRRIYLQTMEEIMASVNKVLIENGPEGQSVLPYLPLDGLSSKKAQ